MFVVECMCPWYNPPAERLLDDNSLLFGDSMENSVVKDILFNFMTPKNTRVDLILIIWSRRRQWCNRINRCTMQGLYHGRQSYIWQRKSRTSINRTKIRNKVLGGSAVSRDPSTMAECCCSQVAITRLASWSRVLFNNINVTINQYRKRNVVILFISVHLLLCFCSSSHFLSKSGRDFFFVTRDLEW